MADNCERVAHVARSHASCMPPYEEVRRMMDVSGGAFADGVDLSVPCGHVGYAMIHEVHRPAPGCEDCLRMGVRDWVHLRECLTCGHVGCCDSSPNQHATAHYHETSHPIMTSLEPGEAWTWCYDDERLLSEL